MLCISTCLAQTDQFHFSFCAKAQAHSLFLPFLTPHVRFADPSSQAASLFRAPGHKTACVSRAMCTLISYSPSDSCSWFQRSPALSQPFNFREVLAIKVWLHSTRPGVFKVCYFPQVDKSSKWKGRSTFLAQEPIHFVSRPRSYSISMCNFPTTFNVYPFIRSRNLLKLLKISSQITAEVSSLAKGIGNNDQCPMSRKPNHK